MQGLGSGFGRALRKVPGIAVGVLAGDRVEAAGLGALVGEPDPVGLVWEIGSITKVFTGILLAEMSLRGEVGLDDPIGSHLPDPAAGRLPEAPRQPTLADLASHTSGLPRLPVALVRRVGRSEDPYSGITPQEVFSHLGPRTRRPRRARPRYSNFGVGLLGHLLEEAAGAPYRDLVVERILTPLGMASTGFDLPVVAGVRRDRPAPPWTFGALEAAGALRSSLSDLLRFAAAVVDPPAGILGEAMELAAGPVYRGRLRRQGLGWMMRPRRGEGRPGWVLWHDGGTYATSSFLAVDRDRRRAVAAFGNRGPGWIPPIERPAWALLEAG